MQAASVEYRIEDLAREAVTTVRNVRAYQDRGLLPRPRKRGRVAVYGNAHLTRLRLIGQLLERGYTLANIKELVQAWDGGHSLGAVLGLVAEVTGPEEKPDRATLDDLIRMFPGQEALSNMATAIRLGIVEPEGTSGTKFRVPSPRLLSIGVELHAAGIPLGEVLENLELMRVDMDRLAKRFIELSIKHIWTRYLHGPDGSLVNDPESRVPEIAALVRRLRPLGQSAVEAELARAMRQHATRCLKESMIQLLERNPRSRSRTS